MVSLHYIVFSKNSNKNKLPHKLLMKWCNSWATNLVISPVYLALRSDFRSQSESPLLEVLEFSITHSVAIDTTSSCSYNLAPLETKTKDSYIIKLSNRNMSILHSLEVRTIFLTYYVSFLQNYSTLFKRLMNFSIFSHPFSK